MRVASRKLNLADDVCSLLHELLNHRSLLRNARALDDLIGVENLLLRVMPFLPLNAVVVEQLLIVVLNLRRIGNEYIETFFLG